ncbi:MAG: protein kinase domain-containing protein [Blastocatellia bacterium]
MTPERWQQIEKLCYEALELDSERRDAFVHQACADDEELRREVESMLAAHDRAGDFLQQNAFEIEAEALAQDKALEKTRPFPVQSFSHYRILSRIGAGGMGEVWLAWDNNLDRNVALKFLPVQFTSDKDRLQRFVREAKSASALNHPNIITIHEIGDAETVEGKTHFIATEFIEGQTLRQVLANEELSLKKALDIASQVAGALDAAHHEGIIHRDIKPENIMLRPDGLVKVLDFGLAKLDARRSLPESFVDTSAKTQPEAMKTQPGMILGTLRYMSPEQARGREVDARTDIFSLGTVLYELIARQPLFAGETTADVIAAIINKEPEPLSDFAPDTPEELERIVHKTLAKDARDRYQTARDLQIDLQTLKEGVRFQSQLSRSGQTALSNLSGSVAMQQSAMRKLSKPIIAAGLLVGLVIVLFAAGKYLLTPPSPSRFAPRITKLFDVRISSGGALSRIEFSPDGKLIAYSLSNEQGSDIWVKQLAGAEAKRVTDGKGKDRNPIWSPDGQSLAFISERGGAKGLWSVPYFGNETPKLIKEIDLTEATLVGWSSDGQKIFYSIDPNLFALNLDSGATSQMTNFVAGNSLATQFRVSQDGEKIAYSDKVAGKHHIFVVPMQGGSPKQITFGEGSDSAPAWFPDGQRIAFSSNRAGRRQIYLGWLDGREQEQLIFSSDDNHNSPTISPTGDKIISIGERENANIFSCDLRTGKEVGHTVEFGIQLFPEVSPDGQRVVFQSSNASVVLDEGIAIKPTGPEGKPTQLVSPGFNAKWSPIPTANTLAFIRFLNGKAELLKINGDGGKPALLADGIQMAGQTGIPYYRLYSNYQWSPDGSSIAYLSAKSGQGNLWTVASDGSAATMLTNNSDPNVRVTSPFWSPDGKRIAYTSGGWPHHSTGKRSLLVIEPGKPETLFETESPMRIIGWSATGQDVYFALGESGLTRPKKVTFMKVASDGKKPVTIGQIESAYLHSATLSFDKQHIAVVSREDGRDNIEIVTINTGAIKRVTNNNDTTAYYSGITWSPDGKTLFYSRQSSWVLASLVENSEK